MVAQGGDGGTVDIGLGPLSGMMERNDDVLYICYDNEAYMNTGVQRSGATPPTARTATTQPVGPNPGNDWGKGKDMARIAMAHEIPYVATATVADLRDLEYKVNKAMQFRGARYIHVLVPCPLGWGSASNLTIQLARLAVQTGIFLFTNSMAGHSVMKLRRPTVEEYPKPQRRFAPPVPKGGDPEAIRRIKRVLTVTLPLQLVDEDYDLATEHYVEFEEARYGFRKPIDNAEVQAAAEGATEQTASDTTERFSANPQTVADSTDNMKAGRGAGEADVRTEVTMTDKTDVTNEAVDVSAPTALTPRLVHTELW